MNGPSSLTLAEAAAAIRSGELSPVDLAQACLDRIEARDGELNSFLTVTGAQALTEAQKLTEELAAGHYRGPLHGIPVAIKDLVDTAGVRTTLGSRLYADNVPDEDATVVRRLRQAGAVILGKTNLNEFALGATNENPHYGPVRNPWDPDRVPGGSSGGSAAAVAARFCFMAIGTDTGGSIRCPANLCGIVGLKPTYGRVSRAGVFPAAWSLDHVGPLTRTSRDAALALAAIAGYDRRDANSAAVPVPSYARSLDGNLAGVKLAVPREHFWSVIDKQVEQRVREAIDTLEQLGAIVEEVSIPELEWVRCAQYLIITSELFTVHRQQLRERGDEYSAYVRQRIAAGYFISAADYADAQRLRRVTRDAILQAMEPYDALLTPTGPIPATPVGAEAHALDGETQHPTNWHVRNTFPFNATGQPALTTPCGFTSDGMPVGIQIVGKPFDEATVLRIADAYEQATGWTRHAPPDA